ncbi:MAG: DoxX family protein [Bacteroidia bacterium]|nr:DoxX family protein [Bacteroidia bacterium]MDW8015729.1 DoxX family protein [Bacteroidia bacterium]
MRAKRDTILLFSRLFVGLLFTLSGLVKVNDIRGFAYKLDEYFEVFYKHSGIPFHEIFGEWSIGIAGGIAVFETSLALFLLLGYWRDFTAWSLLLMIVFFTFLTGYSAITKAVSDCGCFGDAIRLTPWQSFGKDIVLLTVIGYIFLKREEIRPWVPARLLAPVAWSLSGVVTGLTLYFYLYLPAIDFLPYHVGQNLKKALEPDARGIPQITDYVSTRYTECRIDELSGRVVMLVALRLEELGEVEVERWRRLLETLPPDVKVVGVTASPPEIRMQWAQEKSLRVCFAPQDQTVLKAMLRASAGALYLEDGVIRRKWSWRQLPEGRSLTASPKGPSA